MLHTFIGDDIEDVRKLVRRPMTQYLRSSVDLWRKENPQLEKLRSLGLDDLVDDVSS